jgi:dipeptidyl aminopeptidase/acylaminoacyl peptidase
MQKEWDFYADRVRIVRFDRRTGDHRVLTEEWDRSADAWRFAPDGSFFIQAEDRARTSLFRGTLEGGAPREVRRGGTLTGIAPAADGRVYFQAQSLSRPPEIASSLPDGSDYREHTRFNEEILQGIAMGETREMEVEGTGGRKLQMYVVTPPGFDPKRKWPLVHVLHGGPHAISGDAFHFRWNAQLFAAPGRVVALLNFHGSTSFGQEFAASILGDHASKPFEDTMRATDALVATGYVDEGRMAVTGGSYGGYLVSWIAGHTDRFRAIVCHAGVTDLLSQYASDVTQGRSRAYGGEPWDGIERIDAASPTRAAGGFHTPLLVIHGENDYRVPMTQGLELYGILKAKGVPARLLYFPDENHWVLKPQNSRLWYREVQAWLARFLE